MLRTVLVCLILAAMPAKGLTVSWTELARMHCARLISSSVDLVDAHLNAEHGLESFPSPDLELRTRAIIHSLARNLPRTDILAPAPVNVAIDFRNLHPERLHPDFPYQVTERKKATWFADYSGPRAMVRDSPLADLYRRLTYQKTSPQKLGLRIRGKESIERFLQLWLDLQAAFPYHRTPPEFHTTFQPNPSWTQIPPDDAKYVTTFVAIGLAAVANGITSYFVFEDLFPRFRDVGPCLAFAWPAIACAVTGYVGYKRGWAQPSTVEIPRVEFTLPFYLGRILEDVRQPREAEYSDPPPKSEWEALRLHYGVSDDKNRHFDLSYSVRSGFSELVLVWTDGGAWAKQP